MQKLSVDIKYTCPMVFIGRTAETGYCNTAVPYDEVESLKLKPSFSNSFIGYSHRVPTGKGSTGYWLPFVLDAEQISEWELEKLESGNRRRRIRKGLRETEVRQLENLDQHKEEFSRILKSTAIRNGHGNPPEHYDLDNDAWWDLIKRVANYTEFWASFVDGQMAAYICIHVVGGRVIVDGVKSDTDLLKHCPIDSIIYHILISLKERGGIKEMWYGGKSNRESLDKFKESYGFKVQKIHYITRMLGGYIPFPDFMEKFIKRRDDQ